MTLARVKGNVVSTQKNKFLKGHKLLIVHPVDFNYEYIGNNDFLAIDLNDAGIGDIVLIVQEGDAVQQILGHKNAPVNTMIVAIVDKIELKSESN
ncbi:EutN/CcmL family microcompartment protein [Rosettibacter firmus]|uniref:EutN/CcmL family microcompartment protein n=1 Tax=Rosettibacter firmus TaxID=3111522 RepID=UPI00336BD597